MKKKSKKDNAAKTSNKSSTQFLKGRLDQKRVYFATFRERHASKLPKKIADCRILLSHPDVGIQYTLDPTSNRTLSKYCKATGNASSIDILTLHFKKHTSHTRHALKDHWVSIYSASKIVANSDSMKRLRKLWSRIGKLAMDSE